MPLPVIQTCFSANFRLLDVSLSCLIELTCLTIFSAYVSNMRFLGVSRTAIAAFVEKMGVVGDVDAHTMATILNSARRACPDKRSVSLPHELFSVCVPPSS